VIGESKHNQMRARVSGTYGGDSERVFWIYLLEVILELDELKGYGLTGRRGRAYFKLTPAILASSNKRNSTVAGVGGPGFSPAKAA